MRKGSTNTLGRRTEFWNRKKTVYEFHAEAPTSVRPETVPGTHVSVSLRAGWRMWGFILETERGYFVKFFHAFKR